MKTYMDQSPVLALPANHNPEDFLKQLKLKAGMRLDHIPERVCGYQFISIEE